ncbi:MAG TPA: sigma-70 family RNA polymerase sigma factor [Candidatus Latescibacteria bacterium]|nr:sigma-70 family RNA polymerase sigma factor [Candidatus Latescibacterota bacterium]HQK23035.1 sigma-70 family RNA polymerase sigma factor [Candidatus Latescibacterota bacterium]HRS95281.1 sigma-70 family RNA polymerase sigma factor [Candidatus Latescibacterota bacterium]
MSELLFVEQFTRQSEMVTDEDLLAQSLDGSVNAFEVIVNRYKDRLFNFVVRFVGDQETAEDIVQETFLRAYRNRDTFQAVAKFSTWIYTIAGNLAKSELRRRKRWRFLSLGSKDEHGNTFELPDVASNPDRDAETLLAEAKIEDAIARLPDHYREAIILRDIEGLDYDEISTIVGVPLGTVKSRINRGRLRLQEDLGDLACALWKQDEDETTAVRSNP